MRKYCTIIVLLIGCFLPAALKAQQPDITGVWNGELELTDSLNQLVRLPYEIAVSEDKSKMVGYSRIIFRVKDKDEAGMQGISLKWKGKELIIEDEGFVEHDFSINPSKRVKKIMVMSLTVTDTEMILEGTWSTNRTRVYIPAKGTAILKRKVDFKSTAIFKRLDTLKIAEKLSFTQPQKITSAAVAVVTPPVEKPVITPPPPPPAPPAPEPELIIPPLAKASTVVLIPTEKKPLLSTAKILPLSRQRKLQMDAISKAVLKPTPKPVPPPVVIAKPEPVVVAVAPPPKPEKKAPPVVTPKPAPVVAKAVVPVEEKKPAPAEVKQVPKPPPPPVVVVAPSITQGASEIAKRTTKTDQAFYFESDSLSLTLYDNGEVDGDTVTVLMNGGIIFSKQGLSEKPNTKTIYISSAMDSVKLVMYAESLGEIPPNTGLMIIMDGEKRYEVRFSADLKTNAAIILRRKRNE